MGKFHAGNGAVAAYGVGNHGECGQRTGSLKIKMEHVGGVRFGMHHKFAYGNVG